MPGDRVSKWQIVILRLAPASQCDAGSCRHRPDAYDPGDSSGEATPVPIPNTEVKLSSAEDTERAAFRENRSSPGLLHLRRSLSAVALSSACMTVTGDPARQPAPPTRRLRRFRAGRRPRRDRRGLSVPVRRRRQLAERAADPRPAVQRRRAPGPPRDVEAAAAVRPRRPPDVRDLPRGPGAPRHAPATRDRAREAARRRCRAVAGHPIDPPRPGARAHACSGSRARGPAPAASSC